MHITHLKSALEAILFLQHKPITLNRLRDLVDETLEMDVYKEAIAGLMEAYTAGSHGIEIAEVAGGYVFRTKLEHRDMIRRMNEVTPIKMSQAMLEVLSIAAFNQPVTREKIEDIRGVECGHHLRNLMEKKLVKIVGRSDAVGKPMLYGTTKEFLELFGMGTLNDLPTLREIEEMLPQNEVGENEDEENRIRGELQDIVAAAKPLEFSDLEAGEMDLITELDEKAEAERQAAAEKRAEERAAKARSDADDELQAELDARAPESTEGDPAVVDAEFDDDRSVTEEFAQDSDFVPVEAKVEESHGEAEEKTETSPDSDWSASADDDGTQNSEAEHTQDQSDEIAGSVAFGSISPEQEREWESDEKIASETANHRENNAGDDLRAEELEEIAASLGADQRTAKTAKDLSGDGDL